MKNPFDAPTLIDGLQKRVDAAADEQQRQIDALERLILNRAALINIEQAGRKIRFLFARRGEIHKVEMYADMSFDLASIRRKLLED